MDKSKANKIASFINYLNEGHAIFPFEYEIKEISTENYELDINVSTTAYVNEANALAMVIDGCTYLSVRQKYNKEIGILWELK